MCDLPDRVCASLKTEDGSLVYTELYNIRGRVAMVSASMAYPSSDSLGLLQRSVQLFVDQLRIDNIP